MKTIEQLKADKDFMDWLHGKGYNESRMMDAHLFGMYDRYQARGQEELELSEMLADQDFQSWADAWGYSLEGLDYKNARNLYDAWEQSPAHPPAILDGHGTGFIPDETGVEGEEAALSDILANNDFRRWADAWGYSLGGLDYNNAKNLYDAYEQNPIYYPHWGTNEPADPAIAEMLANEDFRGWIDAWGYTVQGLDYPNMKNLYDAWQESPGLPTPEPIPYSPEATGSAMPTPYPTPSPTPTPTPTPMPSGVSYSTRTGGRLSSWISDWMERWRKRSDTNQTEQPPGPAQPSTPSYPATPPNPEGRPYQGLAYKGWKKPKYTWW